MHRLAIVINDIFNHYLPLAEKAGITLNLDFSDTTKTIDDPECIKSELSKQLSNTLDKTNGDEIQISVNHHDIIITDPNTTLSKTACALLSNDHVTVSSRVGFGTKITIPLQNAAKSPATQTKSPAVQSAKSLTSTTYQKPAKHASRLQTEAKHKTRKRIRFEIS